MRAWCVLPAAVLLCAACSKAKPVAPAPVTVEVPVVAPPRPVRDTFAVRNAELERRVSRLELHLLERDATVEDLQLRLEDARAEIVRAMARLPAVASRAEAASAMAETEIALQSLRASGSQGATPAAQVASLIAQGSAEFDKQNYGGALYLANQAKTLAASYRARLTSGPRGGLRAGEIPFAVPLRLKVSSRGNVREGPGTGFAVAFAVASGASLIAISHVDEWIRVSDEAGRSGWIFRSLVARP